MEKKKIANVFANAGNKAKNLLDKSKEKVVQLADQNGDGELDLKDVSIFADAVGDTVKDFTQTIKEKADEKKRESDLKTLCPIFINEVLAPNFPMSKFIRVTERGKKYEESEACQGSIGYFTNQKDFKVVNIFRDSIENFNLTFYPNTEEEFYYRDPSDPNCYIALNEYFPHLKVVRINELQRIAQDLGARHFRVTYKEEQMTFSKNKVRVQEKVAVESAEGKYSAEEKKYSTIEIAAEMSFPGNAPVWPAVHYWQNNNTIQTLIEMRMHATSPLSQHKYLLQMSSSSGMSVSYAAKIDAFLHGIKVANNTSVESEAKNESRKYLEYEIDF